MKLDVDVTYVTTAGPGRYSGTSLTVYACDKEVLLNQNKYKKNIY